MHNYTVSAWSSGKCDAFQVILDAYASREGCGISGLRLCMFDSAAACVSRQWATSPFLLFTSTRTSSLHCTVPSGLRCAASAPCCITYPRTRSRLHCEAAFSHANGVVFDSISLFSASVLRSGRDQRLHARIAARSRSLWMRPARMAAQLATDTRCISTG